VILASFRLTSTAASLPTFDVTVTIRTINVFDNDGVTFQAQQERNAVTKRLRSLK